MCGARARVALCLGLLLAASSASGALPGAAGAGRALMALSLAHSPECSPAFLQALTRVSALQIGWPEAQQQAAAPVHRALPPPADAACSPRRPVQAAA